MDNQYSFAIAASLVGWVVIYVVRRVSRRRRFFRLIGKEFPRRNVYIRGWGGVAVDLKNQRFAVSKKDCLEWFKASQILDLKVEHRKVTQCEIPYMTIDVTLRSELLPALRIDALEFNDLLNIGSLMKNLVENKETLNETKVTEIDLATRIVELSCAVSRLTAAVSSLTDVASTSTIYYRPVPSFLSASLTRPRKARPIARHRR